MASKVTNTWRGPEVLARQRQAGEQLVLRAAHLHRNAAIRLILDSTPGGRTYTRGGAEHQASAAGQPPASDLGKLVQSIAVKHEAGSLTAVVIVGSKYGAALEFGTNRMAPRPFMRPSARDVRPEIDALAVKLMREGN